MIEVREHPVLGVAVRLDDGPWTLIQRSTKRPAEGALTDEFVRRPEWRELRVGDQAMDPPPNLDASESGS